MGTCYEQLSAAERKTIGRLHAAGQSGRAIARTLVRAPTTISRELQRNSQQTRSWPGGHYEGTRAQMLTERRRRWDARHKLARQPALRAIVGNFLAMGWSPEQIAGRLARLQKYPTISPESIYRFIYHRSAQKDYWHRLLPRRKSRRGRRGRRGGGGPTRYLQGRVPISRRPKVASARRQAGHWEADLMLFRTYGQAVLVAHERVSRLTRLLRQPSKAAKPVLDGLLTLFSPLARKLRRSVTFDNGSEFSLHSALSAQLGMRTFFCEPHAPWQKGGIENAIGRWRRPLPRKSDLALITQQQLEQLVDRYNNTPRKCLSFRTPLEVFNALSQRVALQP
jgi:transposase, IS30 family